MALDLAANLQNNAPRIINNPLLYLTPDELNDSVERFHDRHGLASVVSLDVLKRGARVAQDPSLYRTIEGITPPELDALQREKALSFMQQTRELKVTIMTTACAAIVQ
ncbi:MAG: hypothetical protein M1813_000990 [Trichoglossum hirsutum]|nr:MAG: hypothetical protein M1813_000990 [Trichoglossum hirsutum]